MKTGTALWWITPALVLALDERLGPPVDSYVNGSQTWFTGEDQILEWRLHPIGGFHQPDGVGHEELWERVVDALSAGNPPDALLFGTEPVDLATLWDGLECFPAYADELEPATIATRADAIIGIPAELRGLVDHERVADAWEANRGLSIVQLLAEQLQG